MTLVEASHNCPCGGTIVETHRTDLNVRHGRCERCGEKYFDSGSWMPLPECPQCP